MRLVQTFGYRQSTSNLSIPQPWDASSERPRQPRHDDELAPVRLDGADHFVVVKARIRAHPYLTRRSGQLRKAGPEQPNGSTGGMHIACAEFPLPEISGLPLEADEGMIRGSAALARIVPNMRSLLMPVQGQHRRVQIEQHAPQWPGPLTQSGEQAIVQATQLGQSPDGEASEEPSQRSGIGIGRQPRECLEDPIVAEQLGRLDAFQPEDDRVQQGEQHLGDAVRVVSLREPHLGVEALTHMQVVEEAVEEKNTTIPRQVIAGKGDANVPGASPMPHTRSKDDENVAAR